MKKFLFLLIPIFISCGTPEAEIQEEIDVTFSENSSTTTLQQPEEGSELKTTTTTSSTSTTTTTTTIPIPQNTVVVLEINVNHPNTKIKDVREAIACSLDRNYVNENVLQNVAVSSNSLIPADFAFDGVESVYTNINCSSKNYSENFASATNILKNKFTATSYLTVRCTSNNPCIIENLSLRDSNVSPNFTTDDKIILCGPGYDPLISTWSLFVGEYITRLVC